MTNKKISVLTSASIPLNGAEIVPIVQSGVTNNITVNNLAVGNLKSQTTTGVLQVNGPLTGTIRVVNVPDANWTAARTDAAQAFTGNQTLSTGNLIQGTASKGVAFTANPSASGMTSQLLNSYEEGIWTPSLGGTATYSLQQGWYIRIGKVITVSGILIVNVIGTGSTTLLSGLPISLVQNGSGSCSYFDNIATAVVSLVPFGDTGNINSLRFRALTSAATTMSTPAIFQNGTRVDFSVIYGV